jgi:hypothetical protein
MGRAVVVARLKLMPKHQGTDRKYETFWTSVFEIQPNDRPDVGQMF